MSKNQKQTNNDQADRILLITDTHGHLSSINKLIEKYNCDYVLHAGDFGLYDNEHSPFELEERECYLHVLHDKNVPQKTKKQVAKKAIKGTQLRKLCATKYPFSDLPDYITGKKRFLKPVYFVPGNHEDCSIFRDIKSGNLTIENLFLLDEKHSYKVGKYFRVFGLGGNLVEHMLFKPLDKRAPLNSGKYTMGFDEIGHLLNLSDSTLEEDSGLYRIFISHVSPGLEPLMKYTAQYLKVNFAISGHMEHHCVETWTEFTHSQCRGKTYIPNKKVIERISKLQPTQRLNKETNKGVKKAWEIFNQWQVKRPSPFFDTHYINLPDAPDGCAVIISGPGGIAVDTHFFPKKLPLIHLPSNEKTNINKNKNQKNQVRRQNQRNNNNKRSNHRRKKY
ncbi:metallophosphoesterase family protein [Anaeramoeba flamelloides]|uniref:Metallophosphoesterase family protein n=1 Tax=Anaeramoeba flamelloides TaxID=1746091 RepID=A0AAV7ZJW8_9EUKA|nr:metallophosphoesterase family protein [Anaeramoeba flamelloides]